MNKLKIEKINLTAISIMIFIFLIVFIYLVVIFTLNIKEIRSNPLKVGLEKNELYGCSCYKEGGFICFQEEDRFRCNQILEY